MNTDNTALSYNNERQPVIVLPGSQVGTLSDLIAAEPGFMEPNNIGRYCEIVNHLSHGRDYRVIQDPDAYRVKYKSRLAAEDPSAPMQNGVARLSDFGVCDTSEIGPPRRENGSVIFYVEDDFLGIPYRVTAPAPDHPEGAVAYDLLPFSSPPPPAAPAEELLGPVEEKVAAAVAETVFPLPAPISEQMVEDPPILEPLPQSVAAVDVSAEVAAVPMPTVEPTPPAPPAAVSPSVSATAPAVAAEPAPTVEPLPVIAPAAVSPSVPAPVPPVAVAPTPPPAPNPLDLLREAAGREDQATVQKLLLTLNVDKKVCEGIMAAWKGIVDLVIPIKKRRDKMLELVGVIQQLKGAGKVQEELWRLQKKLTKYT